MLTFTPEQRDEDDREKILVRLTPRSLHGHYIETKDLSNDDRMHGQMPSVISVARRSILSERFRSTLATHVIAAAGLRTTAHSNG